MLSKLYKHEWKESARFLLPVNLLGLIIALVGGIVFRMISAKGPLLSIGVFFVSMSVLFFVGLSLGASFLIAMQFYKSVFSDEGYLTLTLPVEKSSLLHVKAVVGSIWLFITELVVIGGIFAWITPFLTAQDMKEMSSLYTMTGWSTPVMIGGFVILVVLGAITSVFMLYGCIAIGQLFTNHRILGAVVAYIVISAVIQLLVMSVMSGVGAISFVTGSGASMRYYWTVVFIISIVGDVVELVAGYFVTRYVLEKKVNLN